MKQRDYKPRILYLLDKQEMEEFVPSRHALREMPKEIFQAEKKVSWTVTQSHMKKKIIFVNIKHIENHKPQTIAGMVGFWFECVPKALVLEDFS